MKNRPQVRIWGIVDLFLLLAVVLMIARVDALAEAEAESDAMTTLRAEYASLEKQQQKLQADLAEAKRSAKSHAEATTLAESKAQSRLTELADERQARLDAESKKRELERQMKAFKLAASDEFKREEDIERYRRLREMVDIIEVTLDGSSFVAIDNKSFQPTRFNMVKEVNDPVYGPSGVLDQPKLEEAILNIRQHISSQERQRVLIMLGYRGSSEVLRESFRKATLEMAESLADKSEVTISQWFTRENE